MKGNIFSTLMVLILFSCGRDEKINVAEDKPSEQKTINLTVDGNNRSMVICLPKGYNNAGKMPMIFAIHGGSGTPEGMIKLANFKAISERDKVVIVYPAGIQNNWNDGRPTTPNQLGINDVKFFNQMCDYMITNYSVDQTKIYATGISNGGFMASRLGCDLSDRIAAIAVVAATIESTVIAPKCNPVNPVPAIYIHGTLDSFVPFTGGQMVANGTAGGTVLSHFQAIDKWIMINKCKTNPITNELPDSANDGTTVMERKYTGGTNGSEVVGYVVQNGGHTWPKGFQYLPEIIIGKTSQDMDANETMWEFFKRFSR